jgi:hypothetical protein
MKLVFIIKNRDNSPFMVVSTTPEGTKFQPMTEPAKELAVFLRQEYSKTKITKAELEQVVDSSKIIEGPSPDSSVTSKKVALLNGEPQYSQELVTLPVLSISEVLLSEFSNTEYRNVLTFKAASFISDQTRSSANFEVKAVRAIWDPSLSIPGTNRRGGFRCPVGTRYGGQITDRFGRSCGWGVARRIANQIADIGERLEQRDDGKRKRRLDRRNARMIGRLQGAQRTGRIEGGLRDIAQRLDGGGSAPRAPRPQREIDPVREANRQEALAELRRLRDDVIMPRIPRRRGRQAPRDEEVDAPSARPPRNRRRDVIPETAPTPKPKPKPKPTPKPAPQGRRRPQPRPQVAPQSENIDVLTAREASDAGESEAFQPYVLRKYNEYAQRVREIREGGGNAGMLTRREWYAVNKDNLRDAWKDVHGRSAPEDFIPPTPRRPQNNRRRRRAATAVDAGRSASRKPTPDDVPEPAPVKPVRRAPRKPFTSPKKGFTSLLDAQRARIRLEADDNRPQRHKIVQYDGKFFVVEDGEIDRANAAGANLVVIAEPPRRPRMQPTNIPPAPPAPPSPVGPTNLLSPPAPPAPPTPPKAPRPRNAPKNNVVSFDQDAAKRVNDRNVVGIRKSKPSRFNKNHGHIEIGGILVPQGVRKGNANISTQAKANDFVKNGGDLDDVPDVFLKGAILANANYPNEPAGQIRKRFKLESDPGNGINNRAARSKKNKTYLVEDAVSGKKYILKSPSYVENEFIGEQYAAIVGQAFGRPMSRVRIAGDIVSIQGDRRITRNPSILVEHYGDVVDGDIKAGRNTPNQVDPVAREMVRVLDAVLGNPDRHPGNFLWVGNEQIPIDHGIYNNGVGKIAQISKANAVTLLRGSVPPNPAAIAQIQDSISKLTVQQIDSIVDSMRESWGLLDDATPADRINIDASVQAMRVNLKNLKEAADELRLARP